LHFKQGLFGAELISPIFLFSTIFSSFSAFFILFAGQYNFFQNRCVAPVYSIRGAAPVSAAKALVSLTYAQNRMEKRCEQAAGYKSATQGCLIEIRLFVTKEKLQPQAFSVTFQNLE
jgi:hypothetical protein